ncbi:hypothetical protein [Actinophytocola sediminis]
MSPAPSGAPTGLSKFYGFTDATMTAVITSVNEALGRMGTVNGNVAQVGGLLPTVNQSTSGIALAARINDWSTEYLKIKTLLEALRDKADTVRRKNVDTSYETSQASQTGQG